MAFTRILESDRVKADRVNQLGDDISAEILKFSTFDLYLKTGNSMNTVKPTGAGTEILTAVGTTEAKIYNFNYALGAETTISKDNRYSFVLPFTRLDTNKTYTFRYVLKVGANTLINVTKNPIAPLIAGYTVEFVSVNQLDIDFMAPAGTVVTLEVWAKSSIADTEIGLLVNDVNTMARTSRNEAVAIVSASGINTVARGFSETQEEFNSWEYLTKAPKNNAEFTGTMKLNSVDIGSAIGQIATNIKMLGAIGDGSSHPLSEFYSTLASAQIKYPHATALTNEIDWAAIQLALNIFFSVFIPVGTYLISDEIVIRSNTTLCGVNNKTIIKIGNTFSANKNLLRNAITTGAIDTYYDTNIIIKDVVFDANNNPNRANSILSMAKVKDFSLERLTFRNSTQSGVTIEGCYNSLVYRCLFTNIGRGRPSTTSIPALWCDQIADGSMSKRIKINKCDFIDNTWSGCYFMPQGGEITDCEFINCGESSIFSNSRGKDISYINNYIYGSLRTNISASGIETGASGIILKNNRISNCGNAGVSLTDVKNAIVTDNVIKNNGKDTSYYSNTSGVDILTLATGATATDGILISNNIITDDQTTKTQNYGVQIDGSGSAVKNVTVANNTLVGNKTKPLALSLGKLGENSFAFNNVGHVDLTPALGTFQTPPTVGVFSVTGIGFKPRFVKLSTVLGSTTQSYQFSSDNIVGKSNVSASASDATKSSGTTSATQSVLLIDSSAITLTAAGLLTMTEDGFTLNFTNVNTRPWVSYVAYP